MLVLEQELSVMLSILILCALFLFLSYRMLRNRFPKAPRTGDFSMDKLIRKAGYAYDSDQNIFYSRTTAWQRKFGYCRLYDEAAAPAGMIIDCEPITFKYKGRYWLIQLWKGQYVLNMGCEIGVYVTRQQNLTVPGVFDGTFYHCAGFRDRLLLSFTLKQNGKELFRRSDKHWWLTGFQLGEFCEPSELTMSVRIVLKNEKMCDAFIDALQALGYSKDKIKRNGLTVGFVFDKAHTPQPLSRTEDTDWIIQRNNEWLCGRYQEITEGYDNWPEKLRALQREDPFLYQSVLRIGRTNQIYKSFKKLKKYIK